MIGPSEGAEVEIVWNRGTRFLERCYSEKFVNYFEKFELLGDILTNLDIILNNLDFCENIRHFGFGGINWPSILFSQYWDISGTILFHQIYLLNYFSYPDMVLTFSK